MLIPSAARIKSRSDVNDYNSEVFNVELNNLKFFKTLDQETRFYFKNAQDIHVEQECNNIVSRALLIASDVLN